MNPSLHLIPPSFAALELQGDQDDVFSLKTSPKETLITGESGAIAPLFAYEESFKDKSRVWACAELVHIHATRDHLVLADPAELQVTIEEEKNLREAVIEAIQDLAPEGLISRGHRWLFKTNEFSSLKTSSPALAIGRNIDAWTPKDTTLPGLARKWRQIQNEIQMIWHDHPVNLERAAKGLLPINSIWLYGIGCLQDISPHQALASSSTILSNLDIYKGFCQLFGKQLATSRHFNEGSNDGLTDHVWVDWADQLSDKEDQSRDSWESIWADALKSLHKGKYISIKLFQEHQHGKQRSEFLHLERKDFSAGMFTKLFNRKKALGAQYPCWHDFMRKLKTQGKSS